MDSFLHLFQAAADHVRGLGVPVEFRCGPLLSSERVTDRVRRSGLTIPPEFMRVYTEVGDGVLFGYEESGRGTPRSFLQLPTLEEWVEQVLSWQKKIRGLRDCDDQHDPDAAGVRMERERQLEFVPLWVKEQDDYFGVRRGRLEYFVYDMMHHPPSLEVYESSLESFMVGWSSVCFQDLGGIHPLLKIHSDKAWPTRDGVLDWSSDRYPEPYRLS